MVSALKTAYEYDVCFYEAFEEEVEALKKMLPANLKASFTWKTIQESGHENPMASLISIRTQSLVPSDWADHLAGILSRSTGYDHLLLYKNKTNSQAQLGYLPVYCHRAVAEQALLLWMSLLRKLPEQMQKFSNFKRDGLTGFECEKKVLLVVGVGNVGYQIVKIGWGLGMQVLGVDLVKKHGDVNYVSIEQGLPVADIIVCAMNLTQINRGYFNYKRMQKAKAGVFFINIARGEMSPPQDILKLIEEGHLGGVAFDVYENETELAQVLRSNKTTSNAQVQAILELSAFPNVILTPHNAFNSAEAVTRKAEQSMRQIEVFLEKGSFIWPIPEE